MKKVLLSCLSVGVLIAGIFSGTAVNAAEHVSPNEVNEEVIPQNDTVPFLPVLVESNPQEIGGEVSIQSVPTYISKKTLTWAIKNTTSITNWVGKYFGKTAAQNVGNVMHTYVKPVLRKLEAFDKVTYNRLEEAIYLAIKEPLGAGAARIGAKAIVEAISIISPV